MNAVTSSPFFGIVLCIASFMLGRFIQKKTGLVIANPLIISTAFCICILVLLDIPYENFTVGADVINWMLGPVTALLALGVYEQRKILKQYLIPVIIGCTVSSAVSMGSILLLCRIFKVDEAIAASILPKSCTTPIALSIAESHGGIAPIAVCCVMISGLTGAVFAPHFCKWFRITDPVAQGLAIGSCSHAIGTTKAREMGDIQGAMSSIAIAGCSLVSVIISMFIKI